MEHLKAKDTTEYFNLWNFGIKVRSNDCHYPIHTVSCGEREKVLGDIWRQHTDILNMNNTKINVEFQPSADQAGQYWDNYELTTYPHQC